MIELAARHGYGGTTVRELTKLAGVSTRTFYERYAGKHECFLCAYELIVRRVARQMVIMQPQAGSWPERVQMAYRTFAHEVAGHPKAARLAFVDAFSAGPVALDRMRSATELFVKMLSESFEGDSERSVASRAVLTGMIGGVAHVVRAHLLEDRTQELPLLEQELTGWMLSQRSPLLGLLGRQSSGGVALRGSEREAEKLRGRLAAHEPRHGSAHEGLGLERARLMRAALQLASRGGALQLTPSELAAEAGISTRRLRQLYDDGQECLLEAVNQGWEETLQQVAAATVDTESWPQAVAAGTASLLDRLASDHAFARVAFVELPTLGPLGLRRREAFMRDFASTLTPGAPRAWHVSRWANEASVGAVWSLIDRHIRGGRPSSLPVLRRQLSYFLLAPVIGADDAVRAVLEARPRPSFDAAQPPRAKKLISQAG